MRKEALALVLLLAGPASAQAVSAVSAVSAVDKALDAELARALADLKEPGYSPPYYVSLSALDVDAAEGRCQMGARGFSGRYQQRLLTADVRVGDYTLDNRPVTQPTGFVGRAVPREDDELALRHQLWRMLDTSYKDASAAFLRKQAVRVSRGKTEYDTDDLTRETPRVRERARPAARPDLSELERRCARASAVFKRSPGLLHAEANWRARSIWTRLRDSEGSRVDFGRETLELDLEAVDISTDGLRLQALRRFAARAAADLPDEADLEAAAAEMAADLEALKQASSTSPLSAPALVDPSVASALVLSIGLRLSGEEQRNPSGAQTFRDRLGKPVLPPDFSLIDDPTQRTFAGKTLLGHYEYDDQGVPPQRVVLIEKGVLKGFLLSRYPVIGFSRSNGHGRAFPGYSPEAMPGNLFLTAEAPRDEKTLLELLRAECRKRGKRYGLWVRKLRTFTQQQGAGGHGSIRILPTLVHLVDAQTGALTLVRDLDLVGTPLVLLGNVIAAGADPQARDLVYGAPMSVVVPSLLLSEVELQRAETRPEKRPILPAPGLAEKKAAPAPRNMERRPIPFVPVVPHAQGVRYVVRGGGELAAFEVPSAVVVRRAPRGPDLVVDVRVVGNTLPLFSEAARAVDAEVRKAAAGRAVESEPLTRVMSLASFERKFGATLPEVPDLH